MPALPELRLYSVPFRGIKMTDNNNKISEQVRVSLVDIAHTHGASDMVLRSSSRDRPGSGLSSRSSALADKGITTGDPSQSTLRSDKEGSECVDTDSTMNCSPARQSKRKACDRNKSSSASPKETNVDKPKMKKKSRIKRINRRDDDESGEDSEVEVVSVSDPLPEHPVRYSKRIIGESPPTEEGLDAIDRCPAPETLENYDETTLGNIAKDVLDVVDDKRIKSKNIYGPFSGKMRDGVTNAKNIIENLVHRLQDRGDPTYLKRAIIELKEQVRTLKKNESDKECENKFLREKITVLTSELASVKKVLNKIKDTYHLSESDSSVMDVQPGPSRVPPVFPAPLPQRIPRNRSGQDEVFVPSMMESSNRRLEPVTKK